jgi:purine-binding chemotaxis protein CheW
VNRARELRDAFDGAFARPAEAAGDDGVDLLAIRVAGVAYALRLAEVSGVFADRPITRVPARARALLGLAGVRNSIIPVFDLAALLGAAPSSSPRWLVIVAQHSLALAFDVLEGQLHADAITPDEGAVAGSTKHASEVVRSGGELRPIISIASLIATIGHKVS